MFKGYGSSKERIEVPSNIYSFVDERVRRVTREFGWESLCEDDPTRGGVMYSVGGLGKLNLLLPSGILRVSQVNSYSERENATVQRVGSIEIERGLLPRIVVPDERIIEYSDKLRRQLEIKNKK